MPLIHTPSFALSIYTEGDQKATHLALCLPGYCDTKDYADMRSHVALLAERGYFAVSLDPPGTWESPGGEQLYTTTNYLQAIGEVIDYFGRKSTLLLGKSMGGRMAQLGASQHSDTVVAFISVVGAAEGPATHISLEDWPTHPRHSPHRDLPSDPHKFRDFTIPYAFAKDASQYDTLQALRGLRMPKLYIAGKSDIIVPPERLKQAYEASATPKRFVVLPMEHDYRRHPAQLAFVNEAIVDFLDEFNL